MPIAQIGKFAVAFAARNKRPTQLGCLFALAVFAVQLAVALIHNVAALS